MIRYNAQNEFNKSRRYIERGKNYDDVQTMRNLEEAFRTSKLWRWNEDALSSSKKSYTMKDAKKDVETTIEMWNDEIADATFPRVHPSKHDKDIFAQVLYVQFRKPSNMRAYESTVPKTKYSYLQNSVRKMF